MPLQFVIEADAETATWRHEGTGAVTLTPEEAKIVAAIQQAFALGQVADGLFAIADAIKEAGSNISMRGDR